MVTVNSQLASAAMLVVAAACTAPTESTVSYDARHGDDGKLDLYLPENDGRAHATVLFIHGGSWSAGDKNHFVFAGRRLARSGFAVASTNYRLVPGGKFPNDIEDCICSLAFVRAHAQEYGIDPDRIVVMGYSAGGQLASLVGLASDDPQLAPDCDAAGGEPVPHPAAVISASGPQDMVKVWDESPDGSSIEDLLGGSPSAQPDAYALASPIKHVVPGAPPFLLIEDGIEWSGSHEMSEALVAAGNVATWLQVSGSLHIFEQSDDPGEYEFGVSQETPEAWIAVESFLFDTVGDP